MLLRDKSGSDRCEMIGGKIYFLMQEIVILSFLCIVRMILILSIGEPRHVKPMRRLQAQMFSIERSG